MANVQVTDVLGNTYSVDRKDATDAKRQVAYQEKLLNAAQTGNFSGLDVDRRREAKSLLASYNAKFGDSGASSSNTAANTSSSTSSNTSNTEVVQPRAPDLESEYTNLQQSAVKDDGVTPWWVDDDYGYDPSNPRKPNMREMMEIIAGKSVEDIYASGEDYSDISRQASDILYGVVGSNTDTRDFNAIMNEGLTYARKDTVSTNSNTYYNADRIIAAAGIATSQMYGGTTVKFTSGGYQTDELGNTVFDGNGNPVKLEPTLFLVGGNGTVLRSLGTNADSMSYNLSTFGVRDASWIQDAAAGMDADTLSRYQPAFDTLQTSYNPWAGFEDMWDRTYATSVTPTQDPFKIVSGLTGDKTEEAIPTGTETDQGVVEQTIQAPTYPTTQPTDTEAPQASEAIPTTTTPYTPTPTTVTGQTVSTGVTGTGVYPQVPVTGTMSAPLQTAGMGAVPQTVQTRPDYTGTTMANLTSQSQQGFGGQRTYGNQFGQQVVVTVDGQGNPLTYVPPGYSPVQGQAQGGMTTGYAEGGEVDSMLEAKYRIASMNGYRGPKTNAALNAFANANEGMKRKFNSIGTLMANKGGYIKGYAPGGDVQTPTSLEEFGSMQQNLITQTMQPQQSPVSYITPEAADFIAPTAGQTTAVSPMAQAGTVGTVQQAQMPMMTAAGTMTPTTAATGVQAATDRLQAQTGDVSQEIQAQQQLTTSVAGVEAAQGTATMVNAPAAREIQAGELVSGVADAEKAATFNEQIQAATATPTKQATVAGQLEMLMQQFEGGETPPWAAGSMRQAMATLSARGLGASSMAGQAVIQAAMEAALPIAQMDAQVQAQFEAQNLSNRQQRAMLAAQQRSQFLGMEFDQAFQARVANSARIGDIANMNFTAEQQIALENSRAANTMNLNNLSNRQAMVMAEAAALANLDMANLNNRQQAAVQNAQNFLQMDMANLSNEQQTAMFKAQQNIQALFTDQAAENAAAQFNATSENQTNQFFANLSGQTSQFNAAQQNAMDQFNVNTVNAMRQFNSEIQQQRDLFNAQNGLVVAQANAQWRQNIATLNTAAQNESNMDFAKTINALTSTNLDSIWQRERDIMSFAFTAQQSALDRSLNLLLGDKKIAEIEQQLDAQKDAASTELAFRFLFGSNPEALFGGLFSS